MQQLVLTSTHFAKFILSKFMKPLFSEFIYSFYFLIMSPTLIVLSVFENLLTQETWALSPFGTLPILYYASKLANFTIAAISEVLRSKMIEKGIQEGSASKLLSSLVSQVQKALSVLFIVFPSWSFWWLQKFPYNQATYNRFIRILWEATLKIIKSTPFISALIHWTY